MSVFLCVLSAAVLALQNPAAGDLYQRGVEARLWGDFYQAASLFERLTERQPDNSDAWVQLGYSLTALQRYDEAEQAFETALTLAPDYADARLGLARLAFYRGDYSKAMKIAGQAGDSAEAEALRKQVLHALGHESRTRPASPPRPEASARSPRRWRADIAAGRSGLTDELSPWSEVTAALGRRFGDQTTFTGLAEYTRRFESGDTYLQARVDRRFGGHASGYLAAGGTPQADFRPEIALLAGLSAPLFRSSESVDGLYAVLDGALAEYPVGGVASLSGGLRYLFMQDRVRLGARLVTLVDERNETRHGYALEGEWQAGDRVRLLLNFSDAPETSGGRTVEVRSYSAGARFALSGRSGLQLYLLHEDRSAYERTGVVVGANWRF